MLRDIIIIRCTTRNLPFYQNMLFVHIYIVLYNAADGCHRFRYCNINIQYNSCCSTPATTETEPYSSFAVTHYCSYGTHANTSLALFNVVSGAHPKLIDALVSSFNKIIWQSWLR